MQNLRIQKFKKLFEDYEEKIDFNEFSKIYLPLLGSGIFLIDGAEETGYKKPDVGIFDYTFNKIAHLDKGTALIIGNSLSSDIQGGLNYEIDTCWYNLIGEKTKSDLK